LVFQAFRHYNLSAMRRSALFHRLIFEAIQARESVRAGNLVLEHILQGRDQLLTVVGDSESVDALFDMPTLTTTKAVHRIT
jgi:DNA-binding FadR family transcriptional regulator